jgi:hypothetical protein
LVLFLFLFQAQVHAQTFGNSEALVYSSSKDADLRNSNKDESMQHRAKLRLYPGGKDEESLKVQSSMFTPSRSVGEQIEGGSDQELPVD